MNDANVYNTNSMADKEENQISEALHTLWFKKNLIFNVTLAITLFAALNIYQLIPRYTASAKLLLGINKSEIIDIKEVLSNFGGLDSEVIGEIEVLKSRQLAKRVINKLHLENNAEFNSSLRKPDAFAAFKIKDLFPKDWLKALGLIKVHNRTEEVKQQKLSTVIINTFLAKLTVENINRSKVISLSYQTKDPQLSAKIVNEITEQYILGQLRAKFDATKKATDWLNSQLIDLKTKVEYSERAVEIFRREHNLVEVSKERGVSQQQLSQINSQLIIARASRVGTQAKYEQVTELLKGGDNIETVSSVLNSSMIQTLRRQEAALERNYSEMLVEFGQKHPRMIQMNAQLKEIQHSIESHIKKIASGLRNQLSVARSREDSLSDSLKQIGAQTSENKQLEVKLRALGREASANRALFETFLSRFKETTSTQSISQADARVIESAEPPLGPSYPRKKMMLMFSFIVALLLAIALVFILDALNQGIRSPEQVQKKFNVPTLGIVPKVTGKNVDLYQYILNEPQSNLTEAVNTLRVSLSVLNPDSPVKTILVTSSVPEEGKTTLSLLLARQSAKLNQRVVLIDTDFRRPSVGTQLKLKNKLGLTNLLAEHKLSLGDVLVKDTETDMMILTRGDASFVSSTDFLASHRMQTLIESLKNRFDLVILDSPPVMAVPDARVLSALVDKVIFVVAWDSTPRKVIQSALHQLQREQHNNIAGIVLQQVNFKQYGRYGYGDSGGYYYHYGRYNQYYSS